MNRQTITVAFAFVGLVVGAGFASGQEILQYFVGFGLKGMWAALLATVVFGVSGYAILQLGSFFLASDHNMVLKGIARPVTSWIFDILITLTLFSMGFVMIAGGGTSLNQQFGLPVWVGSAIITALVILVGMMDVEKVTAVIGAITPFIVVLIIGAAIWAYTHIDYSLPQLNTMALESGSTLPNWLVSAANYVALALALAVSMSIVMGGSIRDPKVAGRGGLIGGILFGGMILLSASSLFVQIDKVADADMPTLTLVNHIHPILGLVMAFTIFGMIFNTAIGMYYALASRFSNGDPKRFKILLIGLALIGFAISFVGFTTFVNYLYPIIGYTGMALVALLVFRWFTSREEIRAETKRRLTIRTLIKRLLRKDQKFEEKHAEALTEAIEESPIENVDLQSGCVVQVLDELDAEGHEYQHPSEFDFNEITSVELQEHVLSENGHGADDEDSADSDEADKVHEDAADADDSEQKLEQPTKRIRTPRVFKP